MDDRFTDLLRRESRADWSAATGHRFVRALCDGTLDDAVLGRYLVQDHRFLDGFLMLLGAAMVNADTRAARLRYGRSAGLVSGEENTYFLRAFAALGIDEAARDAVPDSAPTRAFTALMREAATSGRYAVVLSVLCVAEWLYLDWASASPGPLPGRFVHAEWITLHDNPEFRAFVGFLRDELDRVGPADADAARDVFRRTVAIEAAFFDAAFAPGE